MVFVQLQITQNYSDPMKNKVKNKKGDGYIMLQIPKYAPYISKLTLPTQSQLLMTVGRNLKNIVRK